MIIGIRTLIGRVRPGVAVPRRALIATFVVAAVVWASVKTILGPRLAASREGQLAMVFFKALSLLGPFCLLAKLRWQLDLAWTLGIWPMPERRRLAPALALAIAYLALVVTLAVALHAKAPRWVLPGTMAVAMELLNTLIEELLFRGFLLGQWKGPGFWRANLVVTLLFLAVHVQAWWIQGLRMEIAFMGLSLGVLSLVLGAVTRLSGSIWVAVGLHSLNNLLADMVG